MSEYAPSRRAGTPSDTVVSMPKPASIAAIIGRIESAIEEETASIRTDVHFDIKASNARKSRYLYELNRAMKNTGEADFLNDHRDGANPQGRRHELDHAPRLQPNSAAE